MVSCFFVSAHLRYVRDLLISKASHDGHQVALIESWRARMPRDGEVNRKFGIYKYVCCGADIVIPEDVTFPNCARHMNLPTEWKTLTYVDRILNVKRTQPEQIEESHSIASQ
jgi:hypothetical protein